MRLIAAEVGSPAPAAAPPPPPPIPADAAPVAPVGAGDDTVLYPFLQGLLGGVRQTLADAGAFTGKIGGWLAAEVLTAAGAVQLAAIAATLLIAIIVARRLVGWLDGGGRALPPAAAEAAVSSAPPTQAAAEVAYAGRAADRLRALVPLVLPTAWLLLIAVCRAGFGWSGAPASLLVLVERLLLAWVLIRGATALIAGLFWSRLITWAVLAYTLAFVLGLEHTLVRVLDDVAFRIGTVRLSLLGALRGAIVLAAFFWMATLALRLIERWLLTVPGLTASARVLTEKLVRAALAVIAVLAALHAMGIDATAITVFGGAVGLGIGFGLQQIVANLISGFILLLDRSVKPGDVIAVGDKFGWINAIGARYVAVVTRDGIEHLIPNEHLITNRVENWSHSNQLVRLHAPLGIAYGSDVREAMHLAERAAGMVDRVLRQPPPRCVLTGFGDNAVQLEVLFWISDPKNGLDTVTSDVLLRVWDLYRQAGVSLPFPQRDLHLRTPVTVSFADGAPGDLTPPPPPPK